MKLYGLSLNRRITDFAFIIRRAGLVYVSLKDIGPFKNQRFLVNALCVPEFLLEDEDSSMLHFRLIQTFQRLL